jgi:hypothetical protein
MTAHKLSEADVAYIAANYFTLESICQDRAEPLAEVRRLIEQRRLPAPSYVLDDGTAMFPADYFRLVDEAGGTDRLRDFFAARYRAASQAEPGHVDRLDEDWNAYLDGIYGVCLRQVTPEAIVRKAVLVSSLSELLTLARPGDPDWRRELRSQVDELDAAERQFAPDYDRGPEQSRPPTRDLLIEAARERFPDVFADPSACGEEAAVA